MSSKSSSVPLEDLSRPVGTTFLDGLALFNFTVELTVSRFRCSCKFGEVGRRGRLFPLTIFRLFGEGSRSALSDGALEMETSLDVSPSRLGGASPLAAIIEYCGGTVGFLLLNSSSELSDEVSAPVVSSIRLGWGPLNEGTLALIG